MQQYYGVFLAPMEKTCQVHSHLPLEKGVRITATKQTWYVITIFSRGILNGGFGNLPWNGNESMQLSGR